MNKCINSIQPNDVPPQGSLDGEASAASEGQEKPFHEEIKFKSGHWMVTTRQTRGQGLRMPFDQDQAPVCFCYNLAQRARCMVRTGGTTKISFERRAGDGVLAYLPKSRGMLESAPGENVLGISLYFPIETFMDMFSISKELLSSIQICPSGGAAGPAFYHQSRFDSETRLAIWQILQCPYAGKARELFMEAKALELVALKLAELDPNSREDAGESQGRLMEQARQAHQILVERMADPPDLNQLSRMVGLNRNKLNNSFKQFYGDTVFNILRNARLAKAYFLLRKTELSLVEIAFSIGYNSQANFTTAFRRHFGQSPNMVRKFGLSQPPQQRVSLN